MTTTTSTSRRSSSSGTLQHAATRRNGSVVRIRCSGRADGDFHRVDVPLAELEARRRGFVDLPWTMLDEHHGTIVREVTVPGEHDGAEGDVLVTGVTGAVLGCWVGDCAPVVLIGSVRRFSVAHAGWRGLALGVVDVAAASIGEPIEQVVLGPVIGPCCYEFGAEDLELVADSVGVPSGAVAGTTRDGRLALDVGAAVAAVADRLGAPLTVLGGCTGCTYPGYSHRVRRDAGRHVVAAWQPRPGVGEQVSR